MYEATTVPAVIPVAIPVLPIEMLAFDALHEPPGVASESEMLAPVHTAESPPTVDGAAFTVTGVVTNAEHPDPLVTV